MPVQLGSEIPRASDSPCDPDCPGWAVFDLERCALHGADCDGCKRDCSPLEILACDSCWYGQADAPGDEYYQTHPVCQAQLARERAGQREPAPAREPWTIEGWRKLVRDRRNGSAE